MPKLPTLPARAPASAVKPSERARYVAAALAHGGAGKTSIGNSVNTLYYLGQAVRAWFDTDPNVRAAFVTWYEEQP